MPSTQHYVWYIISTKGGKCLLIVRSFVNGREANSVPFQTVAAKRLQCNAKINQTHKNQVRVQLQCLPVSLDIQTPLSSLQQILTDYLEAFQHLILFYLWQRTRGSHCVTFGGSNYQSHKAQLGQLGHRHMTRLSQSEVSPWTQPAIEDSGVQMEPTIWQEQ